MTPIDDDYVLSLGTLSFPAGVSSTTGVETAWDAARGQWNAGSTNFNVGYSSGTVTLGTSVQDNQHQVFMSPFFDPIIPGTWGSTMIWTTDGVTGTDCDIELFAQQIDDDGLISDNTWTDSAVPGATQMYMGLIMNHELGHCAGFKENSLTGSVMNYATAGIGDTMPPLSTDDLAALARLYGP